MLVKFYWRKKSKVWATAPYKPEAIDSSDFVREYECKNVTEAWNIFATDCHQKVSRMKFEAYAVKGTTKEVIQEVVETVYKSYKAEYEDDNLEWFNADTENEAITYAFSLEKEHGGLFNLTLLDENDDDLKTII